MISLHFNKVKLIQDEFVDEIRQQANYALDRLRMINRIGYIEPEVEYLDYVINLFNDADFLLKSPSEIDDLLLISKSVPTVLTCHSKTGKYEYKKSKIKDEIISALNYKGLRHAFYPKYFSKIGIKACVYCNSQLTVTIAKKNGAYGARFDVDHYHSKDSYPFLSISLFNLYPSCSSCNRGKSTNKIHFELYSDDSDKVSKSDFSFKLAAYSKAKYLLTKSITSIDFEFAEPKKKGFNSFKETFHIEEIYQTQCDLIEELIIKSQIYTDTYKRGLRDEFSKLALHSKLFERVIVGNYNEEKHIHKRPMSKIMMDIAEDLGLIKKGSL
jgi:5-methylcytosine-specific restriction endonuclease McrA